MIFNLSKKAVRAAGIAGSASLLATLLPAQGGANVDLSDYPHAPEPELLDYRKGSSAQGSDNYLEYMDTFVEIGEISIGAGAIRHYDVLNANNEEKLGEVMDIVLDMSSGQTAFLVVDPEDWLLGHYAVVPIESFSYYRPAEQVPDVASLEERQSLYLDVTPERFNELVNYEVTEDFNSFIRQRESEIREAFGVSPVNGGSTATASGRQYALVFKHEADNPEADDFADDLAQQQQQQQQQQQELDSASESTDGQDTQSGRSGRRRNRSSN